MILRKIAELKQEVEACRGKIIRITFDKEGNEAFRNELSTPLCAEKMVLGIVIDQIRECPTCGQTLEKEK